MTESKHEEEPITAEKKRSLTSLYTRQGQRKYLSKAERARFIKAAKSEDLMIYTFCWLLCDTGCRISEVLALTPEHIDFTEGLLVVECLKKRQAGVFRAIPLSPPLLCQLKELIRNAPKHQPIWPWCRMTGYRRIKDVMKRAKINGPQATPKGLRHGFAIVAIGAGVPLNLVQRWLGHADMATTAIYTHAIGMEEKQIAQRMWRTW